MAFGRIGLCVIFLPIIITLSYFLAMDEHTSKLVPLMLVCLCAPFVWIALTVPISVKLDDAVSVRYLLGRFEYSRREVTGVHFSSMKTEYGRHPLGRINFSTRKPIFITVDDEQIKILKGWYESQET